jgi:hypothetical protein
LIGDGLEENDDDELLEEEEDLTDGFCSCGITKSRSRSRQKEDLNNKTKSFNEK